MVHDIDELKLFISMQFYLKNLKYVMAKRNNEGMSLLLIKIISFMLILYSMLFLINILKNNKNLNINWGTCKTLLVLHRPINISAIKCGAVSLSKKSSLTIWKKHFFEIIAEGWLHFYCTISFCMWYHPIRAYKVCLLSDEWHYNKKKTNCVHLAKWQSVASLFVQFQNSSTL